jgi:hypothetical protein
VQACGRAEWLLGSHRRWAGRHLHWERWSALRFLQLHGNLKKARGGTGWTGKMAARMGVQPA